MEQDVWESPSKAHTAFVALPSLQASSRALSGLLSSWAGASEAMY